MVFEEIKDGDTVWNQTREAESAHSHCNHNL